MTNLKQYFGVTITNAYDRILEARLKTLPKNAIARIVIDKVDSYSDYIPVFELVSDYAQIMLQVSDSFNDKQLSDKEYDEREAFFLRHLARFSPFVEISNEIGPSSDWLSGRELQRARNSAKRWIGHERIVTYFWNYEPKEMKEYIKDNPIPCEHKMISFYPRNPKDFKDLEKFLLEEPNSGLSEFGFQQWESGKVGYATKKRLIKRAYEIGSPVFLWDWQETTKV